VALHTVPSIPARVFYSLGLPTGRLRSGQRDRQCLRLLHLGDRVSSPLMDVTRFSGSYQSIDGTGSGNVLNGIFTVFACGLSLLPGLT